MEQTSFCSGTRQVPLVLHLPHNGLLLPDDFVYQLSEAELAQDIHQLVDHHTDLLFAPLMAHGGLQILNPYCRLYFDPERFENPAEEIMNEIGMGVFYTHSTAGKRFRPDDAAAVYQRRIGEIYRPYHHQLTAACETIIDEHGHCFLIDGHSYSKQCYAFERFPDDNRPEIDLGTDDQHTPAWMRELAHEIFSAAGYSVGFDQPYKGTLIPLPLMGDNRLMAMMLEIRRDVYMEYPAYDQGKRSVDQVKLKHFHKTLENFRTALLTAKL